MRIAVLSDIHGNLAALEAVVADFKRRGVDAVVNLGDSLSGPLLPRETAQFLMAQDWTQLAGNHERQVLQLSPNAGASDRYAHQQLGPAELTWMAGLQHTQRFNDELLLCHGAPGNDVLMLLQTAERPASAAEIEQRLGDAQFELLLCGHSHVPRSVRRAGGGLIVNPGSVGQPAYADDYPYPHAVESGSPDARYAVVERLAGGWQAELIHVPYPHHQMAELARLRGRPDWERALLSGYMQ
ncbi:metallophosphoesterase family protein [Paucibacter sp. APW11]|uniref:Metallophosphoesterase family protein n=1 Tax=Roseateles aquae TaxID=3077235 RepID=A0ABU3PDK7_9BURK|nr:metallophosphoesterase family protein [Paucibacter sp. APW11]MDT9000647.1 metallophosphoesterase family protein [Paucibacter sp. APW11]